jgi:alkaline phosphatase D
LAAIGAGAGTLVFPGGAGAAQPGAVRFLHGVASGDPTSVGAIIWTRATSDGSSGDIPLGWHVARRAGERPLLSGRTHAPAARDGTAKVDVAGLRPGLEYVYWFEAEDGTRSPAGRFRTLPRGRTTDWVIAVASCSMYTVGLFNAYDAIAKLERVDMVLHLGDYIYEYGQPDPKRVVMPPGRLIEPPHEIVTLADYRMRHAQVKRDPDAQAMHARAAFVSVWDDHEVANNSWLMGAENHDPPAEGDWARRKAAAMQAYFEWMPIREPADGKPWEAINRSFEVGDLATLAMVETRLLARTQEVPIDGEGDPAAVRTILGRVADPRREMLGAEQQAWLERTLAASTAAGKPWQLLGNQVVMARVAGPDFERDYPAAALAEALARLPDARRERVRALFARNRAGVPWTLDSWDGYGPARERLYASFARARSRPIVLSGDSHASWVNSLNDERGEPAGTEFGAPAVTSAGFGSVLPDAGRYIAEASREVIFCDQDRQGFLLLTLDRDQATAEFFAVSTIISKPYSLASLGRFKRRGRGPNVERVSSGAQRG